MKNWVTLFLVSVFHFGFVNYNPSDNLNTAANAGYLSPLEKELVYEINLFRSNPPAYAEKYIKPLAKSFKGKLMYYPDELPLKTEEGVKAVNECLASLKTASPVQLLYPSQGLSKAARDHVKDQSKSGRIGHTGSDNSNFEKRIDRYGTWGVSIGENIAYGCSSARQIIIYLLIDDGVKDRGHRKNLLKGEFKMIGVASGKHPEYDYMHVMDFAGAFTD